MRAIAITVACLSCVGDGHRLQISTQNSTSMQSAMSAKSQRVFKTLSGSHRVQSSRGASSKHTCRGLEAFAKILLAFNPSASSVAASSRAPAVVVGAGPAGLASAWALSKRGFNVTIIERRPEPSPYEPQRAYLYLIDRRGQKFTDEAQITDELKSPEVSVSSSNYTVTRCQANGDCVELVPPILEPAKDGRSSYWIPRQVFLALLCRLLEGNEYVRTFYGSELHSLQRTDDGGVDLEVRTKRTVSGTCVVATTHLKPVLVVGADGLNSVVREHMAAWSADDSSLGASADEFKPVVLPSPSSGLNYKMLRFPPSFHISNESFTSQPRKAYAFYPSKKASLGYSRLGMLPVANETYPRTANVILPPTHPVWMLTSGEAVREWLKETFPQLPIESVVSKEEAEEFVTGTPGAFPAPCYTPRQHLVLPGATLCLVGDAIHAFPPDIGQGVNSALSDVMLLIDALDGAKSESGNVHTWLGQAIPAYGKSAAAEAKAIAKIAQVGFPYQYSHTIRDGLLPRLKKFFWFANFALRTVLLSKIAPRIFSPAAIVLVQRPNLSYAQVWAQAAATTRLLAAIPVLALLLLALARKLIA